MDRMAINESKKAEGWTRLNQMIRDNQTHQLSLVWNVFVSDYLIPRNQIYLDKYDAGIRKRIERRPQTRVIIRRHCKMDAFDFSDAEVNAYRAKELRDTLDYMRAQIPAEHGLRGPGRAWWPSSSADIARTVIAERRASSSASASGSSKAKPQDSAADCSSNSSAMVGSGRARGADAWSTAAKKGDACGRKKAVKRKRR